MDRPDIRAAWNANAGAWIELGRAGFDVYRDLVNTPAFIAMLPPVDGLLGIDVGCGEGHNTRLVAARGATVLGVDLAELLVAAAATGDPPLSVAQADAAALPVRTASIDFATAFMSLMDVADPERALREIARVLVPGGFVQFSIGHPTTTTPTRRWVTDDTGRRTALTTGGYFEEGSLTERWTFTAAPAELRARHDPFTVVIARRTLTEWFTAVTAAGLTIEAIDEPRADEDLARRHPEVADTRIAPYFLIVRARAAG